MLRLSNPLRRDNRRRGETLTNEKFFARSPAKSPGTNMGDRSAFFANTHADQRAAFGGGGNFVLGGPPPRPQYGVKPLPAQAVARDAAPQEDATWTMRGANRHRGRLRSRWLA
jgi:hypothetical protein